MLASGYNRDIFVYSIRNGLLSHTILANVQVNIVSNLIVCSGPVYT